jgi:hypothetical protein
VPERRQRPQDPAGAAAELEDRRARRHGRVHEVCLAERRQQRVELDRAPVARYRARAGARVRIHERGTPPRPLAIPGRCEGLAR